jgi:hypothetical protein
VNLKHFSIAFAIEQNSGMNNAGWGRGAGAFFVLTDSSWLSAQ